MYCTLGMDGNSAKTECKLGRGRGGYYILKSFDKLLPAWYCVFDSESILFCLVIVTRTLISKLFRYHDGQILQMISKIDPTGYCVNTNYLLLKETVTHRLDDDNKLNKQLRTKTACSTCIDFRETRVFLHLSVFSRPVAREINMLGIPFVWWFGSCFIGPT